MTTTMTKDVRLIPQQVADALLGVKRYRCENCGEFETDDPSELGEIRDITQRVMPGEIMPAGECNSCGALVHGGDLDIVEAGNVDALISALQRLGYTVTPPC